jgi:hypothetical protein
VVKDIVETKDCADLIARIVSRDILVRDRYQMKGLAAIRLLMYLTS